MSQISHERNPNGTLPSSGYPLKEGRLVRQTLISVHPRCFSSRARMLDEEPDGGAQRSMLQCNDCNRQLLAEIDRQYLQRPSLRIVVDERWGKGRYVLSAREHLQGQ
jgi:hypothetical protein